MAEIEMTMPDSATVEDEIEVIQWLVEVGQPVNRGQPLLEVETDRARTEVESFVTGTLKTIKVQGHVIAELAAGITERFSKYLLAPVVRVASADVPVPFAPVLENAYRPDPLRICQAVPDILKY